MLKWIGVWLPVINGYEAEGNAILAVAELMTVSARTGKIYKLKRFTSRAVHGI